MEYPRSALVVCVAAAIVAATVLGGCGHQASPPAGASGAATSLPQTIRERDVLTVATDANYPPDEFIAANGHIVGMDPDLARAIAGALGVRAHMVNVPFASIFPGLSAGKYDMAISSFAVTPKRTHAVDLITYFRAGNSFVIPAHSTLHVRGLSDLCGHTVAVVSGTTYVNDLKAQTAKCKKTERPPIVTRTYPTQSAANVALLAGRADLTMEDSPVAAYQVHQNSGRFKLVGNPYGIVPYGIAVPKNSDLSQPVLAALTKLIHNGTYHKILKKWGLQDEAIDHPTIRGS